MKLTLTSKHIGDNGAKSKVHAMPNSDVDGRTALCGRTVQWVNGNEYDHDHEVTCLSCVKIMRKAEVQENTDRFIAESDARLAAAGIDREESAKTVEPTCAEHYITVTGSTGACLASPAPGHTHCTYHGGVEAGIDAPEAERCVHGSNTMCLECEAEDDITVPAVSHTHPAIVAHYSGSNDGQAYLRDHVSFLTGSTKVDTLTRRTGYVSDVLVSGKGDVVIRNYEITEHVTGEAHIINEGRVRVLSEQAQANSTEIPTSTHGHWSVYRANGLYESSNQASYAGSWAYTTAHWLSRDVEWMKGKTMRITCRPSDGSPMLTHEWTV